MTRRTPEIAWALFAAINLCAMLVLTGGDGGTIPFHLIWVSLTIVYGFTVWAIRPTVVILAIVSAATATAILLEVSRGPTRPDELAEVPLMAGMFVAMVWHARRRAAAEERALQTREREREFIRDASHHLKTPVALARGYAELIRRQPGNDACADASRLVAELERMTKIVDDLLLLMDSDRKDDLQLRPVDLQELAVELADRWSRTVDRHFVVRASVTNYVLGDRERLECALNALFENAFEATETGSRIWVAVSQSDERVLIRVADSGRGLSDAACEHMFDRFWSDRGGEGRQGCGIGLPIAKSIVEAHGGTIDGSREDHMTVFTIALPVPDQSDLTTTMQYLNEAHQTRRPGMSPPPAAVGARATP